MRIEVHVPVSKFSAAILRAREEFPVRLHRGHLLHRTLRVKPTDHTDDLIAYNMVTASVPFMLTPSIAARVKKYGAFIGYHIHKIHVAELMSYLECAHDKQLPIQAELRNYYNKYDISYEDFDLEHMSRQWRRIKQGKSATFMQLDGGKVAIPPHTYMTLPIRHAITALHLIVSAQPSLYYQGDRFDQRLYRYLESWVLHQITDMTATQVAEHLGYHKSTISRRIATMNNLIEMDERFATVASEDLPQSMDTVLAMR